MLFVRACLVVLAGAGWVSGAATPVPQGQVDTFEDGTLSNWAGGAILANVTGGPTGRYLQVQSALAGAGRWGTQNQMQWGAPSGQPNKDYLANNITAITMDMANLGPDPLYVRLMLTSQSAGQWASNNYFYLPAGSDWRHLVFGLTAGDLTQVSGTGSLSAALGSVTKMNLTNDPAALPSPPGNSPVVNAVAGIDNIAAVPEPGTVLLLAGSGALVALRRRGR